MLSRRSWLLPVLLLCLLVSGCGPERMSGTEVGNPEVTVLARFGIVDEDSSASISKMELKVMVMEYQKPDNSMQSIWDSPAGMQVDLAAPASAASLAPTRIPLQQWKQAELSLATLSGDATLPDSIVYGDFSNPRYIKLVKRMNGDTLRILFQMPTDLELKLRYSAERLAKWSDGDSIRIAILFDCGKWATELAGDTLLRRMDAEGKPYIVLSPEENAAVYRRMESLLPTSFVADGFEMR